MPSSCSLLTLCHYNEFVCDDDDDDDDDDDIKKIVTVFPLPFCELSPVGLILHLRDLPLFFSAMTLLIGLSDQ